MFKILLRDIRAARERDPAARSNLEILLCYSGVHAIMAHRIVHRLWQWKLRLLARWLSQVAKFFTNIEIHPGAVIGEGFFIDHGTGTVIGETSNIGDGVTLFQGVTLGGTGKETGKRHPTLEDNVTVGSHAQILGSITIGEGSVVGSGAVVVDDIPPYCTVVGSKAYVARRDGQRIYDFHHERALHAKDPEMQQLLDRIKQLEEEVSTLKAQCEMYRRPRATGSTEGSPEEQ